MREVHIKGDLTNKVLRIRKQNGHYKLYYFDEKGIYRCVSLEEAIRRNLIINSYWNLAEFVSEFPCGIWYRSYILDCEIDNERIIAKAICRLEEGDTIKDLEYYLSITKIEKYPKPEGIERFITKIEKPQFVRSPGNNKKETFDYIYIDVNIISHWEEDRLKYIQKHRKEIDEMVIDSLERSKEFQKFGIPVNFLKVSRITLRRDSVLEFVLELKI